MYVTSWEHLLRVLRAEFDVPMGTLLPRDHAGLFLRVDPSSPKFTSPVTEDTLVALQFYGEDLEQVIELAGQVRFFLLDRVYAADPKIIAWNEQAGPHDFPDPDTNTHFRWQITGVLSTNL